MVSHSTLTTFVAFILIVVGCTAQPVQPAPPQPPTNTPLPVASPTPVPTPPAAAKACQTEQLLMALCQGDAATGHRRLNFLLVNTSKDPCVLRGYPQLVLLGDGGQPLPTTVKTGNTSYMFTTGTPSDVVLRPNEVASFAVGYAVIPTEPQTQTDCRQANRLQVTPPGNPTALTTQVPMNPCGGEVSVSPIVSGATGPQ